MTAPIHFGRTEDCVENQTRSWIPLSQLKAGQKAIVAGLEGNSNDVARLSEMGFRRGVEFEALRNGTTAIVKVNCQTLCLRLNKEMVVRVQPT
jgi:Fe2+ transport system protein FeoA